MILPTELIENPNGVWIDGAKTPFEMISTSFGSQLIIPLPDDPQEIKIMGTRVMPEFEFLVF